MRKRYDRVLPANELFTDRWEKAAYLGFGAGASIYDSACVFGNVKVGANTWVGPFSILDGTGGITIGANCSVGAGTHIYTHDTMLWALSGGKEAYQYTASSIGDNCFVATQCIIQPGVHIGKHCVVLANTTVTKSVPDCSVLGGSPAKIIGKVILKEGEAPEVKFFSDER